MEALKEYERGSSGGGGDGDGDGGDVDEEEEGELGEVDEGVQSKRGRTGLRGAALDVATPEPLPADHPLWDAANLILTPHISGSNTKYAARALQVLERNLQLKAEG